MTTNLMEAVDMNDWKLTDDKYSTFAYELNNQGVNRWCLIIQAGFDDNGERTSEDFLHQVARKVRAADEMYKLLQDIYYNHEAGDIVDQQILRILEDIEVV